MTINLPFSQNNTNRNKKMPSDREPNFNSLNPETLIFLPSPYFNQDSQLSGESETINRADSDKNLAVFNNLNRGRVAIFIDGSNLFYAASHLNIEVNYTKLLQCLIAGSRLLRPFFYTAVDPKNEKQKSFLLWMRRNGYRVITKELVEFADGSKKADLDVEISVDMMTLIGCYDTAVLVSGNGNLAYAVDAVSYRGIRVEVVSLRSMTSDNLINVADAYVDLDEIKTSIQKTSFSNYFA